MPKDKEPKIRQYYNPKGKEKEALEWVYKRYEDMKNSNHRQDSEKRWDMAAKNWEAYRKEKDMDEWQSNHFVPLTSSIIESILSEMVEQQPRPLILPRGSEDVGRARVMRYVFDYTWEVADGDIELFNIMKDSLIFGTAICQEYYWQDRRIIKLPKGEKGKYEETEVMDYDDSYMECVKLEDFFVDERARDVNRGSYNARDCIRRYIMNIKDVRLFFQGDVWNPLGNVKYVRPGGDTNYYEFFQPPQGGKEDDVEVLWYWSKRPEDSLIVIANDVVLRMGPNPYRHKQLPFSKAVDIKRTHFFYGKGEAELLESIQDELNTLRRMVLDRNHLDIDKMFLVSNRETLDDEDLIARPHGSIPVDDPSSVKSVEYGDIPRSVQLSIEGLTQEAVRVTGIEDRSQGVRLPDTATGAALLKESTLKRIRMKLRLLERSFLVDVGRQRVANILQFYNQPKLEQIIGEAGTVEYHREINRVARNGNLEVIGGKPYQKKYKEIRIDGKELLFNEKGRLREKEISGFSFFELKPEYFIPVSRGGYNIKFEAGSTIPLSKPLLQSKTMEMINILMPLALQGIGYDPVKLGDALLKVNDYDPAEFKVEKEEEGTAEGGLAMQIELASMENEMALRGEKIPSLGTPNVSPAHTHIHLSFLRSERAKGIPATDKRTKLLFQHAMGEMAAQSQRESVAPQVGTPAMQVPTGREGMAQPQAPYNKTMKDVVPNLIQGGEEVQKAI